MDIIALSNASLNANLTALRRWFSSAFSFLSFQRWPNVRELFKLSVNGEVVKVRGNFG